MSRTLPEVLDLLKNLDECLLVELLGVTSENIVDRFVDMIEEDPERFELLLEDFYPTDDEETES